MISRLIAGGFVLAGLAAFSPVLAQSDQPSEARTLDPTLVECTMPFKPAVTLDGATATMDEINELAAKIRRFQDELLTYRACLEPGIQAAKDANDQGRYAELIDLYNQSVTAEEEIVAQYQAVIEAHKAANG